MMIGRIDNVNPLNNVQNTRRTQAKENTYSTADQVSVSDEAKAAAEAYYLNQVAAETPDIRQDLVAAIKEKIKDPNYLNQAVIASTADRILASYGL
ncbi:flagellar biosynthesis anti-sigma factor FlgM [Treponema sp. UBA3813]|uniref:flagellar biosynthesis anti-sigma factor FlgM n=1 Tax=Treponema sp. UBA3813 TaxID=1947715 RepID=UPI002600C3AC|nr:flagellar biosynthesis anti-sigma factor FlgM [Treponema sp. UBA3813]